MVLRRLGLGLGTRLPKIMVEVGKALAAEHLVPQCTCGSGHGLLDSSYNSTVPGSAVGFVDYLFFNIETDGETLAELEELFRYNDAIIRSLVMRRDEAVTEESQLAKNADEKRARKATTRRPDNRENDNDDNDNSED